jgi:hypothetical protein
MRSLLPVESFDLCPSNQHILARMSPCCFRVAKMSLRQINLLSKYRPRNVTSSSESCTLLIWKGGGHVYLRMVNVTCPDMDPLAFILDFLNQFSIAVLLACSFCEANAGSLSVASTTVSSAKVSVLDSGEVSISAEYSRYNNGPRTLTLGTPALSVESFIYSVSTFTMKCLLCK